MRYFNVTHNRVPNKHSNGDIDINVFFDGVNVAKFICKTVKAANAVTDIIENYSDSNNRAKHLLKMKLMKNHEANLAFILNFKECSDLQMSFDEMSVLCSPLAFLKYLYKM